MKSVLQDENKEKPFPKLMKSTTGGIFLMHSNNCGVCLHKAASHCDIGDNVDTINTSNEFKDYEGSVILSND